MLKIFRAVVSYFTLKWVTCVFIDVVSFKSVCLYVDCYGEYWLKDGRWSLFRVKADLTPESKLKVDEMWHQLQELEVKIEKELTR